MKKTLCLLILLSLLLCACGIAFPSHPIAAPQVTAPTPASSAASPAAEPSPTPEPAPTPEPTPAATPEPVVIYDAFYEAGTYYDDMKNAWPYVLRIPAIQASGQDATRLNQELFTALYPAVDDAKDCMIGGYSLAIYRVDYTVYINGQLISILCETDNDWGQELYYVVNFDASTKTEFTRAQLLDRFGLTEGSFLTLAADIMEQHFQQNYNMLPRDQMYWDRHDKSVAKENFTTDCQLYVNDGGQLCMIVKLYSFAGADYYYHIFPVK